MRLLKHILAATVLSGLIFSNTSIAEDLDAFKQLAKSNAMILMDTSGSMSWPVYNPDIDYAAFMNWLKAQGLAEDKNYCTTTSWLSADYSGINPKGIYLVKSPVGHRLITYTDSEGASQSKSAIGDVMSKTSSSDNDRNDWLMDCVIPCKNLAGSLWLVNDEATIDTETVSTTPYVIFPKGTLTDIINGSTLSTTTVSGRLKNQQDVPLHKIVTDNLTNQSFDYGFLGFLNSSGYYFSGVFEKNTAGLNFTAVNSEMDSNHVYIFATGNWLNFIKLVEDFYVSDAYSGCTKSWTYSYQQNLAWKYFCYKPGELEPWVTKEVEIRSHDIDYNLVTNGDYPDTNPPGYDPIRGTITIPSYAKQLQIKFQYVDTDFESSARGRRNDFVEIIPKGYTKSILAIAGNDVGPGTGAYVSTSNGDSYTWSYKSNFLNSEGYTPTIDATEITIRFNNGSVSGQSGLDRGFRIIGYRYVTVSSGEAGDYTCCNGLDGYGYKIKSRMDVAKAAMINAVQLTKDTISWGLSKFNSSEGGTLLASLGTSPESVISELEDLEPGGSTPLGEALQSTYNFNYNYLKNNAQAAQCSANFVLAVTDGFPSYDTNWSMISTDTSPDFGVCSTGYNTCTKYGDSDVWKGTDGYDNFMDDVAHWMYNKAKYKHTVHSIAFGLDNPMLGDVADSSNGIYITAYNEEQLLNAFYSLGLSMTNAISFAAPAISVDEENRAQAGDELYMAFFRPNRTDYWEGNLKRFKISWNATEETVVDQFDAPATNDDGTFRAASRSFWSTENDGGVINKGGAGAALLAKVKSNFTSNYYDRLLWTHKGNALTPFTSENMLASDLSVADDIEKAKIINFMYGFTKDADSSGNPKAVRNWIIGDIIHSEPVVIDYVDSTANRALTNRYIAIGSNHGVLHVFNTVNGEELFGFIPPALWTSLKSFATVSDTHLYGVDGQLSKFQTDRNPELLTFGLRRGGRAYYALDISSSSTTAWDVAWTITNDMADFSELGQTWSKIYFSTLPQSENATIDIGVFSGGYDPLEDSNSTSFLPQGDSQGRGIFVVNATDGSLVFKCTYGDTNSTSDPKAFTRSDMKYCFPADPRVIRLPDGHKDGDLVVYAVDIAGQLWKLLYDMNASPQWQVFRIFNSNGPTNTEGGSNAASGYVAKLNGGTLVSSDSGRKCFTQPDCSYAGDCSTDKPVIYFGTGDRENPLDTTVKHRFYGIYDQSTNNATSEYYGVILDERDLLNVSNVQNSTGSAPTTTLGDSYSLKAQGWYISFVQQVDNYNHTGEKLTSSPRLFNKIIFFTTYKPTFADICAPNGDSLLYAIKYCSGAPAYIWTDSSGNPVRYQLHQNSPLASSWRIMAKEGVAAGKISVGAKLVNIPIVIPAGLNLIWWDYD